jgi:hypothetical protein
MAMYPSDDTQEVGYEMTITAEAGQSANETPGMNKARRALRTVLVVVVAVIFLAAYWAYSYSPLVQNFNNFSSGEYGSYVANADGVEAHYTITDGGQSSPMGTQTWVEPTGKFFVQTETEITNSGSHAVRIDHVGQPSFGYQTSGYQVSFYRNVKFPYEAGAAFHPFVLAAHSQRMVVVSYSQRCATGAPTEMVIDAGAIFSGPSSLPVTYSFLGFAHTVDVPVAPTAFQAPRSC